MIYDIDVVVNTLLRLLDKGFWPVVLHAPGESLAEGRVSNGKEPVGLGTGLNLGTQLVGEDDPHRPGPWDRYPTWPRVRNHRHRSRWPGR